MTHAGPAGVCNAAPPLARSAVRRRSRAGEGDPMMPDLEWGERLLPARCEEHATESLGCHRARLGPRPSPLTEAARDDILAVVERSGLRGRGGAGFPTASKWRAVRSNSAGRGAVVVVNAAEGEPASAKDRTLLAARPHLVLDGAEIAADVTGAGEVVVAVARPFTAAIAAVEQALRERAGSQDTHPRRARARLITVPHRYVAGEESALVAFINGRPAKPVSVPPRPFERGVDGRPTLVQNVETLAHAALIARRGDGWFRGVGTASSPGSLVATVTGAVRRPGTVVEVAHGTTIGELVELGGGAAAEPLAVLLGGYFGAWLDAARAWETPLDTDALRAQGASPGCGVVAVLPATSCPVTEVAAILTYLAAESAGQCGPCVHGLGSMARTLGAVAHGPASPDDLEKLVRWGRQVTGRGACRHPDGAVLHLRSALLTFAAHLEEHANAGPCAAAAALPLLPVRRREGGWR